MAQANKQHPLAVPEGEETAMETAGTVEGLGDGGGGSDPRQSTETVMKNEVGAASSDRNAAAEWQAYGMGGT